MTTISAVFGHFTQNFPRTFKKQCLNLPTPISNLGTVLLARKFNLISIAGGSALCITDVLITVSFHQLTESYQKTGGSNESVIRALRTQSIVQSVILSRIVASAIGHPISWFGMAKVYIIKLGCVFGTGFMVGLVARVALEIIQRRQSATAKN